MEVQVPLGEYLHSKEVKKTQREERAILAAVLATFAGVNVLGGLTIKSVNSWLGYKRIGTMTCAMKALYKNRKLFHNRLKVLENTSVVLSKWTFSYLQAVKTGINGHNEERKFWTQASGTFCLWKTRNSTSCWWYSTIIIWQSKCFPKALWHA